MKLVFIDLLGTSQSVVSALERGQRRPGLEQICTLSMIYGRNFESLFADLLDQARDDLRERIATLPATIVGNPGTLNREASLQRLERRLAGNAKRGEWA